MTYVKENLTRGERVVYTTSLHWIIFSESFFILLMGIFLSYIGARYKIQLGSLITFVEYTALGVYVFGGVKFLLEFIRHRTSEFAVTNERVIIKVGVLQRKSLSMPLSKIESIEIDQSIPGRIFGFGSINITGTGNAESKFDLLTNPSKFRQKMSIMDPKSQNSKTGNQYGNGRPTQNAAYNKPYKTSPRRRRRRRR